MDTTVAVLRVVVPEIPPNVARMVVWPAVAAKVIPALLIVATALSDVSQVTRLVKSCVEPFDSVPVALNCRVVPTMLVTFAGVTPMDANAADVSVVVVDIFPDVAVIVTEPAVTAATSPFEPAALLMEATALFDELHTTDVVRSRKVPSENAPIALSWVVVPVAILTFDGVILMEDRVTGADLLPHPESISAVVSTIKTDSRRIGRSNDS